MPASSESRRRESLAVFLWSRMNVPRSRQRSGSCLGTESASRPCTSSGEQALDRSLTGLVPADDLGLELVDPLVERAALVRAAALDGAESLGEFEKLLAFHRREICNALDVEDLVYLRGEIALHVG